MNPARKIWFQLLRGKRDAFRRLFLAKDGYPTNDGELFLREMRRFCYGRKPTLLRGKEGAVDPYASVAAAARQEVYFRIIDTMNLSEKQIVLMERRANEQETE